MKKETRKRVLAKRLGLTDAEAAEKSAAICAKLTPFWDREDVKTIMVYMPFRKEVDLKPLIEAAWAKGKWIAAPICGEQCSMLPALITDFEKDLEPGSWNILEPKEGLQSVQPEDLDLVIVPGVAFDKRGNRLGYGAGYYDRFLPRLRPGVPFISVCFELQIEDNVYPDSHDIPMRRVITEKHIYPLANNG